MTPAEIKTAINLSDVVRQYVELTPDGGEMKGRCPFHEDGDPSFKINNDKGFYHCFGCGAHGDVIDFVARYQRMSFAEARAELERRIGGAPADRPRRRKAAPQAAPVLPVPSDAPPPTFVHVRLGTPAATWTYRAADGAVLGYVCRFNVGTGKQVLPRHYVPGQGWAWISAPKPRPLYGLELLAQRPGASVIVVEGEKACDAARALLPGQVCVTWSGGGKAVKFADWTPLRGRKVLIWPDADAPGIAAAEEISGILQALGCELRVVDVLAVEGPTC